MTIAAVLEPSAAGPYRYLDYFNERDRLTFAGREEDIAEVTARASADEPFVLYARSGLGKTSLLLAGVFPILRERRLTPIHIRVQGTPKLDLRNAIAGELGTACRTDANDLDEVVAAACRSGSIVLVFDQFEEFFINTRGQPNTRREFIHHVAALVHRSRGDVRVTFSLREDYLAELDEFHDVFPDMLTNQHRLHPLTAFGARQAIVAPLVAHGIEFDQRLVVRLVDMLAEVDFDPVLLQIACGEVYREAMNRQEGGSLTEADLDKVGGIQGLFERYLDNAIARVPREQLLLCRAMLDALITPEETKRAVTFEALLSNDDFSASREELQSVLDCLKNQKLVRPELRGERLFYELSHDRLGPSVAKWFKRDADFSQFRDARDLIANATRRASFPDKLETLIGAAQIQKLIAPYRMRLRLTPDQRALMFWSAVYSRVEDTAFWAGLVGADRARDALLQLFAHPSAEARLGAANASEQLASDIPGVTGACLTAALGDPDPAVRHAASRALGRLAGDDEILALKTALRSRRTLSRALDVLATFVEVGGPIKRFSRFWRFLARRRASRLAIGRHRDQIKARAKRGALVGVMAAAGWSATIGVVLASLAVWLQGEVNWTGAAFRLSSIAAASAGALAAVLGWVLGGLGASRAAARGVEGRWASVTWRVALVAGIVAFLLLENPLVSMISEEWLAALVLCLVVAGFHIRLFRSSVWPPAGTTLRERVGWALLLGLPLAVPAGALGLFSGIGWEDIWMFAAALSAAPTIVALILSESAVAIPIGTFPRQRPWARLVTRTLLVLSAVALPVLFVRTAALDSIPFFAATFQAAPDFEVPLPLERDHVDSVYFNLESNGPAWFVVDQPAGSVELKSASGFLFGDATYSADSSRRLLYLPQGRHLLSATSNGGAGSDSGLRLRRLPLLNEKPSLSDVNEEGWSPYAVRLDEVPTADSTQPRVWRAVVPARLSSPRDGSVRVLLLAGNGVRDAEIEQVIPSEVASNAPRVDYSVSRTLNAIGLPLAVDTGGHPELQPIRLDPDGTFRLVLTYRLRPNMPESSSAPRVAAPEPKQPLYIPIALAIRGPDFSERLVASQPVGTLVPRLREDSTTWKDVEELGGIADLLSREGRRDESIELHRRIVELKPEDAYAQNGLAWELIISKRGREALEPARRAAALSNREDEDILDTLAHAEYEAGNFREAVQAWDETLKRDPSYYSPPDDEFCLDDLKMLEDSRRRIASGR